MSLRDALVTQAAACAALGSPFYARLARLVAERLEPDGEVARQILDWPGDVSYTGQSVPLRLLGALHGLVLGGTAPELAAVYPPHAVSDDALWQGVDAALRRHPRTIGHWLSSPPQTNEVRRSAVLIPVGHWLARRYGLPLRLSELGASAGLNLMWDRYALLLPGRRLGPGDPAVTLAPEWHGPLPHAGNPVVAERRGVDLAPPDRSRLLAYIWPDQADRLGRTRAAAAIADASVDQGDAAPWLAERLAAPVPDRTHVVFHTIAWQYFPPETRSALTDALEAAGRAATPDAPLAWFGMENGSEGRAALTLRLWPGDETLHVGRADAHGRRVDWAGLPD